MRDSGVNFWLLDHGLQLVYEPFGWTDEWYVDIVSIRCIQHVELPRYEITDSYADLVVEAMGPTYRILDLDELADALRPDGSNRPRRPTY